MTFCTRCGKQIEEGQVCSCSANQLPKVDTSSAQGFLMSMKNRMGLGDPSNDAGKLYERGMMITPASIKPTEGETPIKQYNVAILRNRLKLMRSEARMQITNKRILFRATGLSIRGKTTLQQEFAIDEVAGLEYNNGYRLSLLNLFFSLILAALSYGIIFGMTIGIGINYSGFGIFLGLLFGVAGTIPVFIMNKKFMLKVMPCAGGLGAFIAAVTLSDGNITLMFFAFLSAIITIASMILASFIPDLIITIKNKSALPGSGAIVLKRTSISAMMKDNVGGISTGFTDVMGTEETNNAFKEINAIIIDIQKLGDFGIEKWLQI